MCARVRPFWKTDFSALIKMSDQTRSSPPSSPSLSLFRMFFDVEFKAAANVFFIWHTFRRASLPTPSMQSALKENSNDFGLVGL